MKSLRGIASVLCVLALPALAQADVKWMPIEAVTVKYELTGSQTGTVTQHSRKYGRESVQINESKMTVMGFTTDQKTRVISKGRDIISLDLNTNIATKTENPFYDSFEAQLKDKTGKELGEQMLRAMGATPTGESGSYAGISCDFWSNSQFGQRICISDEGISVFIDTNMMGVSITWTATDVTIGDAGPDSAYELPPGVTPQEMPNIMNMMNPGS